MTENMRVILLSFACCNPKLAVHDQQYLQIIQEALKRTGQKAQIDLVHVTEAMMSKKFAFMSEIMPLFDKYGSAIAPAIFVNEKLELFGGVPTVEKLMEVFLKYRAPAP
jgi:metal-dependent amidase/aminoacylase/carboxypeptidase family protein